MSGFDRLLGWLDAPLGDASRIACFLEGGRFDGDRASITPPASWCIYVTPCDGSCRISNLITEGVVDVCGSPTHWHDLDELDRLGDAGRHGAYYVLVATAPAPSGMRWALYWSAGHERPTARDLERARNDFERRFAVVRLRHQPPERGIAA